MEVHALHVNLGFSFFDKESTFSPIILDFICLVEAHASDKSLKINSDWLVVDGMFILQDMRASKDLAFFLASCA